MIFFVNAQGVANQVTPSSVNQGSNNASEIVLIAPFAQSISVTMQITLPNGIALEPQAMIPLYDAAVADGLGVWRATLARSVTEYSGTASVAFALSGEEEYPTTAGQIVTSVISTTATATFSIKKGYVSIGTVPETAPTYAALAQAIQNLANQLADVNGKVEGWRAIDSLALDGTTLTVYFSTSAGLQSKSVSLAPLTYGTVLRTYLQDAILHIITRGDGGEQDLTANLSPLVGGIEHGYFDDVTNTLNIVFNTAEGQETASINLNDLLDDLALTYNSGTASLTLTAGGATKVANLGDLQDGNVTGGTVDVNGNLILTLRNANGTTRNLSVSLGIGYIQTALDEIIDIQDTLIGVPEYDGSVTIVTN